MPDRARSKAICGDIIIERDDDDRSFRDRFASFRMDGLEDNPSPRNSFMASRISEFGLGMMPGSPQRLVDVAIEDMETPPKGFPEMQFEHVHKSFATGSVLTEAQVEKVNEILEVMAQTGNVGQFEIRPA